MIGIFFMGFLGIYAVGWLIGKVAFRKLTPLRRATSVMGLAWAAMSVLLVYLMSFSPDAGADPEWKVFEASASTMLPGALLAWWLYWRGLKKALARLPLKDLSDIFS